MTDDVKTDKLRIKDGWIDCRCGKHLLKILPDTEATSLPLFCRFCRQTTIVDIERGQSARRRSP